MQEEGLTNEGNMHKQVHDDIRGIAESQHAYINRAKLIACEVGIFSRGRYNSRKYAHPLFEEPLKFTAMGLRIF